ncbi:Actin family [Trypanosoma melophagium]|uniref:Actin family n=1 Tax=Trypanosoma melophagium TaxID=715481 RepID=UPI00351AA66C|nr:Actin family [Trypanosoma melophagium]
MRIAENTAKILSNVPLPDEVAVVHRQAAIVDIGSCTTRVGFAGDDTPRLDEPTCVVKGTGEGSSLCLKKAYDCRDKETVSPVVVDGELDWDAMELLLRHLEEVLHLGSKDLHTPLLLTEKALVPRTQRQRLAELLMEKHSVSSLYFAPSPVLSLYAEGTCTGLCVEMSHDASHVVPVFQGYPLFHATHALPYGGRFLTNYMMNTEPPLSAIVHPNHHVDVWKYLKEKYCETCPNAAVFATLQNGEAAAVGGVPREVHHRLPDGTIVTLGPNRLRPAELFFDAALRPPPAEPAAIEAVERLPTTHTNTNNIHTTNAAVPSTLHALVADAIGKCDRDLAPAMYGGIYLAGGTSRLRGLRQRLEAELVAHTDGDPVVFASPERRNAAFVGGSILASLPTFQGFWVTRADYDECGSAAVLRQCF